MDRPLCCPELRENFGLLLHSVPVPRDHLGWDLHLAMWCSRTGPPCPSSSTDQSHFLQTGNWRIQRQPRIKSSFSSRLVDGCEHTNLGDLACGGIKTECEGRVHTPALTEQCPVAAEPQVQSLLGALSIAQLGKIYPAPRQLVRPSYVLSKHLNFRKGTPKIQFPWCHSVHTGFSVKP